MEAVFLKALNMSLAVGWLILVIIVLRPLLRRAPRSIHCLLWGLVAIRLICPLSPESVLSLIPSAEIFSPSILYAESPAIQSGIGSLNQAVNPALAESLSPALSDSVNPMQVVIAAAAVLWLIGVTAMLLYAAVSYFRLRRRVADAVRLRDNLWQSEHAASPFILGILHPRIYLPYTLSDADMSSVIAHEQAHLRRRDHLIKPLGFLLLSVYWFHPLVWLAYALLCRDIELACDERVIRDLNPDGRKAYLNALLSCSLPHRAIAACPLAFGEIGVKARIRSVLSYRKPAFWLTLTALLACIAVAVCFLTSPPTAVPLVDASCIVQTASGMENVAANRYPDGQFDFNYDSLPSLIAGEEDILYFDVSWDGDTLAVAEDYYAYPGKSVGVVTKETYTLVRGTDGRFALDIRRRHAIREESAVYYVVNGSEKFVFMVIFPVSDASSSTDSR
ncbi:MAG: M56 family metallopeptidase [Clostridiaceae bacterium]|nr:M56 family metallopeptidase [Clostridiaceae bacterium]